MKEMIEKGGSGHSVVSVYGAYSHEHHKLSFVNPLGRQIEWPFGCFHLEAFDCEVDFSKIFLDKNKIEEVFEISIKNECEKEILEAPATRGIDYDKILECVALEDFSL